MEAQGVTSTTGVEENLEEEGGEAEARRARKRRRSGRLIILPRREVVGTHDSRQKNQLEEKEDRLLVRPPPLAKLQGEEEGGGGNFNTLEAEGGGEGASYSNRRSLDHKLHIAKNRDDSHSSKLWLSPPILSSNSSSCSSSNVWRWSSEDATWSHAPTMAGDGHCDIVPPGEDLVSHALSSCFSDFHDFSLDPSSSTSPLDMPLLTSPTVEATPSPPTSSRQFVLHPNGSVSIASFDFSNIGGGGEAVLASTSNVASVPSSQNAHCQQQQRHISSINSDRIDIMDILNETPPVTTTATIELTSPAATASAKPVNLLAEGINSQTDSVDLQNQSPSIVFTDGYWLDSSTAHAQSDSDNSSNGQQVAGDVCRAQHAIARELGRAASTSSSSISSMLMGRSTQDLADEIARVLVDKALEKDRKRLLHLKAVKSDRDLSKEESNIVDTYAEVAANRVLEKILDGVLEDAASDLATVVTHGSCQGDLGRLKLSKEGDDVSGDTLLQSELRNLFEELSPGGSYVESFGLRRDDRFVTTDSDFALPPEHPFESPFGHTTIVKRNASRHKCTEMCMEPQVKENERGKEEEKQSEEYIMRDELTVEIMEEVLEDVDFSRLTNETGFERRTRMRNEERRKRNGQGILLSSLKKKVYHCRCVDCQAERKAKGEPEPTEAIEIREVNLSEEVMGAIPIVRKRGRGRPRMYPRLDDLALVDKYGRVDNEAKAAKKEEKNERMAVVTAASSPFPSSPSFVDVEEEDSPPGRQLQQEGENEEEPGKKATDLAERTNNDEVEKVMERETDSPRSPPDRVLLRRSSSSWDDNTRRDEEEEKNAVTNEEKTIGDREDANAMANKDVKERDAATDEKGIDASHSSSSPHSSVPPPTASTPLPPPSSSSSDVEQPFAMIDDEPDSVLEEEEGELMPAEEEEEKERLEDEDEDEDEAELRPSETDSDSSRVMSDGGEGNCDPGGKVTGEKGEEEEKLSKQNFSRWQKRKENEVDLCDHRDTPGRRRKGEEDECASLCAPRQRQCQERSSSKKAFGMESNTAESVREGSFKEKEERRAEFDFLATANEGGEAQEEVKGAKDKEITEEAMESREEEDREEKDKRAFPSVSEKGSKVSPNNKSAYIGEEPIRLTPCKIVLRRLKERFLNTAETGRKLKHASLRRNSSKFVGGKKGLLLDGKCKVTEVEERQKEEEGETNEVKRRREKEEEGGESRRLTRNLEIAFVEERGSERRGSLQIERINNQGKCCRRQRSKSKGRKRAKDVKALIDRRTEEEDGWYLQDEVIFGHRWDSNRSIRSGSADSIASRISQQSHHLDDSLLTEEEAKTKRVVVPKKFDPSIHAIPPPRPPSADEKNAPTYDLPGWRGVPCFNNRRRSNNNSGSFIVDDECLSVVSVVSGYNCYRVRR